MNYRTLKTGLLFLTFATQSTFAFAGNALPTRPTDLTDPASNSYPYSLEEKVLTNGGREVRVFRPKEKLKAPAVVFGAGWTLDSSHYRDTFVQLARKGYAVIYVEYASGMFDQDWARMAEDYAHLAQVALASFPNELDDKKVVFSGHSKGAYAAMMAAGLPGGVKTSVAKPQSVVVFNLAGYDASYVKRVDSNIPVTLIAADGDTTVKPEFTENTYKTLPSAHKQQIRVQSYNTTTPKLVADHYFTMSKKTFIGGYGQNGVTPLHFYGSWKWLIGAAQDLDTGDHLDNPYLYGPETKTTGLISLEHQVTRNW